MFVFMADAWYIWLSSRASSGVIKLLFAIVVVLIHDNVRRVGPIPWKILGVRCCCETRLTSPDSERGRTASSERSPGLRRAVNRNASGGLARAPSSGWTSTKDQGWLVYWQGFNLNHKSGIPVSADADRDQDQIDAHSCSKFDMASIRYGVCRKRHEAVLRSSLRSPTSR